MSGKAGRARLPLLALGLGECSQYPDDPEYLGSCVAAGLTSLGRPTIKPTEEFGIDP